MAKRTRQTQQQTSSSAQSTGDQTDQPIVQQEAPVTDTTEETTPTPAPKKTPRTQMQKALGSVVAAMTPQQRNAILAGDSEAVAGLVVALQTEATTFVERIKAQLAALERQLAGPVAEQNGAGDDGGDVVAEMTIEKENVAAE